MADYKWGRKAKDASGKRPDAKNAPLAYVFIGRDQHRTTEERDAQGWRRMFLGLAALASTDEESDVKNNRFGLNMIYDALTEMEADARAQMGDEDFEAAIEEEWEKVLAGDAKRAERAAKRADANEDAETAREEREPEPEPEATTPAATPARRRN